MGTGWRIGAVVGAVTVVMIAVRTLVPEEYSRDVHALRAVLLTLALGGIALAACRWLDRRPLAELGLARRGAVRTAALGAAAWLLPAAAAIAVCVTAGWVDVDVLVGPGALAGAVASQLLLVLLLEALPEELVFRGYVFTNSPSGCGDGRRPCYRPRCSHSGASWRAAPRTRYAPRCSSAWGSAWDTYGPSPGACGPPSRSTPSCWSSSPTAWCRSRWVENDRGQHCHILIARPCRQLAAFT